MVKYLSIIALCLMLQSCAWAMTDNNLACVQPGRVMMFFKFPFDSDLPHHVNFKECRITFLQQREEDEQRDRERRKR
jgi:hypothetical protein